MARSLQQVVEGGKFVTASLVVLAVFSIQARYQKTIDEKETLEPVREVINTAPSLSLSAQKYSIFNAV
jgi:hypothetical protein